MTTILKNVEEFSMKRLVLCTFVMVLMVFALSACAMAATTAELGKQVGDVLDKLHLYAAKADGPAYFALYTNDAVFFGTDKSERWPISEFKPYAQARFDTGTGWTYKPIERNVFFSKDQKTAWFDERLENKAGEARGTGVLVLEGKNWKIAQYNLSFPVPNDLFDPIYEMIRIYEEKK